MRRQAFGLLALVLVFCLPPLLSSCSAAGPIAAIVATGAKWLGSVLDTAEARAKAYNSRHPSMEREAAVKDALDEARATQVALAEVSDAATKKDALAAYVALRKLMGEQRILSAEPPDGGAETDSPMPEAFELPDEAEARAQLEL